jgi:hypothetical protein
MLAAVAAFALAFSPTPHPQDHLGQASKTALVPSDLDLQQSEEPEDVMRMMHTMNIHHAGMNPHHSTGASVTDPYLFSHRYQHHNPETDVLTYYEYNAKRHPHVAFLAETSLADDVSLEACTSSMDANGNITVKLLLKPEELRDEHFKLGNILVLNNGRCKKPDGSSFSMRERLISHPVVHDHHSGAKQVSMVVEPTGLHECFEHSTLEFFRGEPHVFRTARNRREQSLADKNMEHISHAHSLSFASTDTVIGDAKAAAKAERSAKARARLIRKREQESTSPPMNHTVTAHLFENGYSSAKAHSVNLYGHKCDTDIMPKNGPLDPDYFNAHTWLRPPPAPPSIKGGLVGTESCPHPHHIGEYIKEDNLESAIALVWDTADCYGVTFDFTTGKYSGRKWNGGDVNSDNDDDLKSWILPKDVVQYNTPDVGGWGGLYTCPSGKSYNIGDNNNYCGSLAGSGGISGKCVQSGDSARTGVSVKCAPKQPGAPTFAAQPNPQTPNGNVGSQDCCGSIDAICGEDGRPTEDDYGYKTIDHNQRKFVAYWSGTASACAGNWPDCTDVGADAVCTGKKSLRGYGDGCWGSGKEKVLCVPEVPNKAPQENQGTFGCKMNSGGETPDTLVPGGKYRLVVKSPGRAEDGSDDAMENYFRVFLFEADNWNSADDVCNGGGPDKSLPTVEWGTYPIPMGVQDGKEIHLTITIPENIFDDDCSSDGALGFFPEYYIRLKHVHKTSWELGRWPPSSDFRLVKPQNHELSLSTKCPSSRRNNRRNAQREGKCLGAGQPLKWEKTWKPASGATVKLKASVESEVEVKASTHVLVRTTQLFPYEEVWGYSTPTLEGEIEFEASMVGKYHKKMDEKLLFETKCAPPTCYGGKLAGMEIMVGMSVDVKAYFAFNFSASLEIEYERKTSTSGIIEGHAVRHGGINFEKTKQLTGFRPESAKEDSQDEVEKTLALNVDALANATLAIGMKVGLVADAGYLGEAEATVNAKVNVAAQLNLTARAGIVDNQANVIDALPASSDCKSIDTCGIGGNDCETEMLSDDWGVSCCKEGGGLPKCLNQPACTKDHKAQLDIEIPLNVMLSIKILAKSKFLKKFSTGPAKKYIDKNGKFEKEWWFTTHGIKEEKVPIFALNFHILTICLFPVSAEAKAALLMSTMSRTMAADSQSTPLLSDKPHQEDEATDNA